jgi:CheY-like chemotaxis protein
MLDNLLIVEDNRSMRRLIKSIVADMALCIHECEDGTEALDAYEKFHPEWVLMDVEMRQKDGFTATREIIEAHPEAKIVIVTKYSNEGMRKAAKKAGACEYVLKENLMEIRAIIH